MKRVVITGIGCVLPGCTGSAPFLEVLKTGRSLITALPELGDYGMACRIGGKADVLTSPYLPLLESLGLGQANDFVRLSCAAASEAFEDSGFTIPAYKEGQVDYSTGIIMGSGIGAIDIIAGRLIPFTDKGEVRRMRSTIVEYSMFSSSTANVAGMLGLGNMVLSVSSACSSATDAIALAAERIRSGKALRMLAGGVEVFTPYTWSGFDAMQVLTRDFNDRPAAGSCPMSAASSGFVPSSGASVLVLEDMDTAMERGARIYAEIAGWASNSGGQRGGGSMTIPNPEGVVRCIREAFTDAGIEPAAPDLISGHLTSTIGDVHEVRNWKEALQLPVERLPYINAPKSMTGHLIGAAGSTETIACALQLYHSFIHPSINCAELAPEIQGLWPQEAIPRQAVSREISIIAKASFGFGDVNACLILKRF